MRILYCAIDQRVPGTLGGSVHVRAVAEGLAALGHDVHALVGTRRRARFPTGPVHWHAMARAARPRAAALVLRAASVTAGWRDAMRPDVVMERYHNFGGEGDPRGAQRSARVARARSECAGHRSPRIGARRWLDRALLVRADAALARVASARSTRPHRHAERRRSCRRGVAAANASLELEWGADTERFRPGAHGPAAVRAGRRARSSRCSPAPSARGTAPSTWSQAIAAAPRSAAATIFGAVFIGDGPELPRRDGRRPRARRASSSPARCRTTRCRPPRRGGHRRRAVRRRRARAAGARLLLVAAEGLRVHGVGPAGRRARAAAPRDARRARPRRPALRPATAGRARGRAETLADPDAARALGAAARARAVRDYSWAAHCRALDARRCAQVRCGAPRADPHRHRLVSARLRRQRLEHATSWRAGLRARGHAVVDRAAACPGTRGARRRRRVRRLRASTSSARTAPPIPFAPQLLQERAALPAARRRTSPSCRARAHRHRPRPARAHGTGAAIAAAARRRPAGGRDGARLLAGLLLGHAHSRRPTAATLCPACTVGRHGALPPPRTGAAWPAALPLIPYMRRNLARKRTALAAAGRRDRREPPDRRGPARARARARRNHHRAHPESVRHQGAR